MANAEVSKVKSEKFIEIKGARVNNLKNISVSIPRNKLVVITGLSGSGKSSLAFDTLYAEGQRRYVESLSSYARQFLGRMNKPDVDYITGISPAIAIEQKVTTRNPRSTVGTSTEIYEYLKLLFARIGKTYSPVSGELVRSDSVTDVVNYIASLYESTKVMIFSPVIPDAKKSIRGRLEVLLQQGFSRIVLNNEIVKIEDILREKNEKNIKEVIQVLIDRFVISFENTDLLSRIADSVETAFYEGKGKCFVEFENKNGEKKLKEFSNKFEADGILFEEPSVNLFAFNNPYGACKTCEGFGNVMGIDEDLVVPDKTLSVYDDAIACWRGEKMSEWKEPLVMNAYKFNFPIHTPYGQLSKEEKELIWTGNKHFHGLNDFFKLLELQTYKIQYRVMLSRYRGKTFCPECKGTRLRKDASYVKICGSSISELVVLPLTKLYEFFNNLDLNDYDKLVSERLLVEIRTRLQFLLDVGLGYLTLNRLSSTLSGGESQRINLATYLGSSLVGSMYILDEPSIGLHPRDTHNLIKVLKSLRDIGNSVIVVEHDEDIIRSSDSLIDIGPLAGAHGGEIMFNGTFSDLMKHDENLTSKYLTGKLKIKIPESRRKWKEYIEIVGARQHNLKSINVKIPLNAMTVITGVSGSGKTTLVKNILYPALKKIYGGYGEKTGQFDKLDGDVKSIAAVEMIDQNPIGRSSRSNPVTYIKAYDEIRELYSSQQLARMRGYKPGYFSFNIAGGRCEECEGAGEVTIEMQFMADINLVCEECKGKRFKSEVLDVTYRGKNISDILEHTVDEAIAFFSLKEKSSLESKIISKLKPLADVGLGYIKLGQASSTLSGGEAQRVKLAYFLSKGNAEASTLFIFDEPTTGLHFHDINKLLVAFNALIKNGHSVLIVEHNGEIIKSADWVIDLGPEGGENGGTVVFAGTPEELIDCEKSYTAKYLKKYF
ncbi:MAG TPA: excinuclease ABC subunit UvrA [Bacteroidales bacterium]|nr:excinuclease ABC subunit UvrA [Bacteroidales bacterium]HPS17767.1 excinuclease ABC subunit UvrA [Bacteroidales bacterium]